MTPIPVIDMSPFLLEGSTSPSTSSLRKNTADAILDSLKTIGFACLINHGVDKAQVDGMFDWSRRFFSLPLEQKMLAPHPPSGTHQRGYSPPGLERVSQRVADPSLHALLRGAKQPSPTSAMEAPPLDLKEAFDCGRRTTPRDRERGEGMTNVWLPPGVLDGFKEACEGFYQICQGLEMQVLKALSIGLGLEEDYLGNLHQNSDNQLRLLHYPSVRRSTLPSLESLSRIAPHTDYATVTLLFQDSVGGLEIESPDSPGVFVPVQPIEGSVLINAGDFMSRWSNDTIKSTLHRVRAPLLKEGEEIIPERYSMPYFCSCDYDTVVDTLPGTWDEGRPKKYEPISAGEYVAKRLLASYDHVFWTSLPSMVKRSQ